jgi:hypothetical protein
MDRFNQPVQLNFNKSDNFPSAFGTIMTIVCYSIVVVYAI